ncbi:MAG: hypothetical protein LBM99_06120 [Bacillales bacterium]|jgi:hypothetical protein|nr:hypothetical protein [Bacillales bacterium]
MKKENEVVDAYSIKGKRLSKEELNFSKKERFLFMFLGAVGLLLGFAVILLIEYFKHR